MLAIVCIGAALIVFFSGLYLLCGKEERVRYAPFSQQVFREGVLPIVIGLTLLVAMLGSGNSASWR
jgi:hypothetical protein